MKIPPLLLKSEMTLREAQKTLSREVKLARTAGAAYWREYYRGAVAGGLYTHSRLYALNWLADYIHCAFDASAEIDAIQSLHSKISALAARYGADTRLADIYHRRAKEKHEYRPKGTSAVLPDAQPGCSGRVHGGDGASQEVPDGQSEGGEKAGESNCEMADSSAANTSKRAKRSVGETSKHAMSAGIDSAQEGENRNAATGAEDRVLQRDNSALDNASYVNAEDNADRIADQKTAAIDAKQQLLTGGANAWIEKHADERLSVAKNAGADVGAAVAFSYKSIHKVVKSTPTQAKKHWGGITAELKRVNATPSTIEQVRKIFARLLDGGESTDGLRLDANECVKRMIAHRPLSPARKEEDGRPAILVLSDVSGSCAGFSEDALVVAKAVSEIGVAGADVVVVAHSNGFPEEIKINRGRVKNCDFVYEEDAVKAKDFYTNLLQKYRVEVVVALGDADAEWLYRFIASSASVRRVLWLSNYACNRIDPKKARCDFGWGKLAIAKLTYVIGCKDAGEFVAGLNLCISGG